MTTPHEQPSAPLTGKQRKWLRGRAHALEPVVHVGHHGVTEALLAAIDAALQSHELIKVKLHAPEDKHGLCEEIGQRSGAEVVGLIGHVLILYRRHPTDPELSLPA